MNNLDKSYQALLSEILVGNPKSDRTGTGTISIFGKQIRHKMSEGFPLLTTKKMAWKSMAVELKWFLAGDTNIKFLVDNNCNIWNGDAWKAYTNICKSNSSEFNEWMRDNGDGSLSMYTLPQFVEMIKTDDKFAKKWGELGPIYGKQWRHWEGITDSPLMYPDGPFQPAVTKKIGIQIDQFANLINDLKNNPDSRRLMVSAWNVPDVPKAVLPPCFTPNMLVGCVDGYRKISELTTNDIVLTEDGSYQKVYELHETKYNDKLIKLRVFGNTEFIEVTPNHPFLVKNKGYVEAIHITKEDFLGIPINNNSLIPSFKTIIKDNQHSSTEIEVILSDKKYWYLMGYFLGDGWLIDSKQEIYFSVNDEQEQEILPRLREVIGLAKLNNSGENCKKHVGKNQQLFAILSLFGKYAEGKFIPQFVHDAPTDLIEEFIAGYQKADGCITPDGISYTTVSKNIAYGLQLLYAKLKIKASVYHQNRPKKTIIEGRIVNQQNTFSINVYKQKNKSTKYIFDNDYLWLKIKDIKEESSNGYVYNISVEGNHTYNVFNLINHNCHYGFQCYTRELTEKERWIWLKIKCWGKSQIPWDRMSFPPHEWMNEVPTIDSYDLEGNLHKGELISVPKRAISLSWNQRSVDTLLGLPFNIASYGLLLMLIAKEVNMVPEDLIGNLGDTHLYINHLNQAHEQISRESFELPTMEINDSNFNIFDFKLDSLTLKNYKSQAKIEAPLSN